jgi:hypothetical protein
VRLDTKRDYVVDGVVMTNMEMFMFAVQRYGRDILIITLSKAVKVLREKGHVVEPCKEE